MCVSLLKKPQFSAELRRCDVVGSSVVPRGTDLLTETDVAVRIARLGAVAALQWERLCCIPSFLPQGLVHRVVQVEVLDVGDILRAERELLQVQKTQRMFEKSLRPTIGPTRRKVRAVQVLRERDIGARPRQVVAVERGAGDAGPERLDGPLGYAEAVPADEDDDGAAHREAEAPAGDLAEMLHADVEVEEPGTGLEGGPHTCQ